MTGPVDRLVETAVVHRLSYAWQHPERPDVRLHTARSFGLGPTRARLVTVQRPVPQMDEAAFETAVGAFHRAYAHAKQGCMDENELQEATREALEAFLGAYEECRS